VSLVSQYLGFFAWYRGLALGGIARVGQLQLLQPFLTLLFAALLVREPLDWMTAGFAGAVVACVAIGRRMPVRRGR
jgi:drug/metabolite transporter (DMT)-like permease